MYHRPQCIHCSAQEYYYPWSNGVNSPENRTMKRSPQSFVPKRKHRGQADAKDLEGKVKQAGLLGGLSGLERHIPAPADSPWVETNDEVASGLYGSRVSRGTSTLHRARLFRTPGGASRVSSRTRNHDDQSKTINSEPSKRSRFTRASTRRAYGNVPAVHVVCAISENMARETCVASLDAGSPLSVQVTKQGNGQIYSETIAYLEVLQPDEVLLNEGRRTSQLTRKILEFYEQQLDVNASSFIPTARSKSSNKSTQAHSHSRSDDDKENDNSGACSTSTVVKFVSRASFDQTKGAEVLRKVAREETYDATVVEEYILLSSAHALLSYTQQSLGVSFAPGCVFLSVNAGGNNRMVIDRATMLQLELLVNSKTGKSKDSLIGTIDKTKTTVGSRLLRTNLIAPPIEVETINARLDLVDTFLGNENFFYDVEEQLRHLPDLDKILSSIALVPRNHPSQSNPNIASNVKVASRGISSLVCIKSALTALPAFLNVLKRQLAVEDDEGTTSSEEEMGQTNRNDLSIGLGGQSTKSGRSLRTCNLLQAISMTMSNPALTDILDAVSAVFTPSTEFSRNANAMRHQECFALKADEEGVVSLLRKSFLANVDDIYKKADEYAEMYGITVVVRYNASRGYFLSIPSDQASTLPDVFRQATLSGRFLNCTTEEIASLNTRSRENVNDLLVLTYERTQEVMAIARKNYDAIASVADAVALLDFAHSCADTVSLSTLPWCRPIISSANSLDDEEEYALIIKNGRFGIEIGDDPDAFVGNDTFTNNEKHFTVISGINGSGKSTYLKQLAMIAVLAHCGSYVPAEQCTVPIRDRICARISSGDDQENNISSFLQEMKEAAFICSYCTRKSLVLIDELGRATSNNDGVSIAWAVAEYLLKKRPLTFFVTHYPEIFRLDIYPSVQNIHLAAKIQDGEISYSHKAEAGSCQLDSDYGVKLAALCGWPEGVVREASDIESTVDNLLPNKAPCEGRTITRSSRLDAFDTIVEVGRALKQVSASKVPQTVDTLIEKLRAIKEQHLPDKNQEAMSALVTILNPSINSKGNDPTAQGDSSDGSSSGDSDDTSSLSSSSSDSSLPRR